MEHTKAFYQDVCYPVTKEFREKLYNEIISEYEKAKDKSNEKARENAEKKHGKFIARSIVNVAKVKGRVALYRVSEFLGIKKNFLMYMSL